MDQSAYLRQIVPELTAWYRASARALPWRETPTPYRIWISEIMLQQTRIEAVKPYYQRFLEAFPNVAALAAAPEETVLKLWEGLGYYSRARNLQKAAQICVESHGGELPRTYDQLRRLPGIGSYTAGAIASIAWGERVPAVDGNVLRVLSRILENGEDIGQPSVKKAAEKQIQEILPEETPGAFNEGIMELGETVCIPGGKPLCDTCPIQTFCLAHQHGTEEVFPVKTPKRPRRVEEWTILRLEADGRVAVRKRPEKGLLAGLYEFPAQEGFWREQQVEQWLREQGSQRFSIESMGRSRHIFTHVEWHMQGYRILLDQELAGDWIFVSWEQVRSSFPLPTALQAYWKEVRPVEEKQ